MHPDPVRLLRVGRDMQPLVCWMNKCFQPPICLSTCPPTLKPTAVATACCYDDDDDDDDEYDYDQY